LKKMFFAALFLAWPMLSARGAEDKIVELQKEVKALRQEVARLTLKFSSGYELGQRMIKIAEKLKAGGKIEKGSADETALVTVLRLKAKGTYSSGDALFARAVGLIRKLPAGQRAGFYAGILLDITIADRARSTVLAELKLIGDAEAKKVVGRACDLELLLPQVTVGYSASYSGYFLDKLVNAAADMKDKRAVTLAINSVRNKIVASLKRQATSPSKYGTMFYGSSGNLVKRLGIWCGDKTWSEFISANKGRGYRGRSSSYAFKGPAQKQALVEIEKVQKWWDQSKDKFEFPVEPEPKAAEAKKPVPTDPVAQPKHGEAF
jgi:hypothetical protein